MVVAHGLIAVVYISMMIFYSVILTLLSFSYAKYKWLCSMLCSRLGTLQILVDIITGGLFELEGYLCVLKKT